MKTVLGIAVLLLFSCSGADPENQLQEISGYWEIEKVVFPDGDAKEYTISQTIDYFELNPDSTGFRKKLQPRLNGRFLATDDAEQFTVKTESERLKISYTTALDQWEETILIINKNQLVIKSNDNLTYFYKRFEPMETAH